MPTLSRCTYSGGIATSYRVGKGESLKSHQAASVVLEELADSIEQAAFTSALVYCYIQAKSLWKDHLDPKVTSAEAFLDTLDNSDYHPHWLVGGSF